MYNAIASAESSVYLEMYIFLNDTFPSHNFYELLGAKAEQGVNVKIIIDAFGSATTPYAELEKLRKRGAEVIVFNEWFRRTHRKVVIVDEKIGFIGGVNIGQQFVHWLDLHVMVTGRVVEGLIGSFAKSYKNRGAEMHGSLSGPRARASRVQKHGSTIIFLVQRKTFLVATTAIIFAVRQRAFRLSPLISFRTHQ